MTDLPTVSARNYWGMTTTPPRTTDSTRASVGKVAALLGHAVSLVDAGDVLANDLAVSFELASLYTVALALSGGESIPGEDDPSISRWGSAGDCLDAAVAETSPSS